MSIIRPFSDITTLACKRSVMKRADFSFFSSVLSYHPFVISLLKCSRLLPHSPIVDVNA